MVALWHAASGGGLRGRLRRGLAAPIILYREELQVRGVVHGDDFPFLGYLEDLNVVETYMRSGYEGRVEEMWY